MLKENSKDRRNQLCNNAIGYIEDRTGKPASDGSGFIHYLKEVEFSEILLNYL
jgi:hypothetical protein